VHPVERRGGDPESHSAAGVVLREDRGGPARPAPRRPCGCDGLSRFLQEAHRRQRHARAGLGRGGGLGLAADLRDCHAHARRSARRPPGHGRAGHVPDRDRQRPGLHRHAGEPQCAEPGLPERTRSRHRRLPDQLWRGELAESAHRSLRRREHRGPRVLSHHRQHAAPRRARVE